MNLRPLGDRVLVKPKEAEDKTKGGIYIPDSAKEKTLKGQIVAVGPGRLNEKGERIKMEVKTGDMVMYKEYGGTEFTLDGAKFILLDAEDLLGVFE